MIEALIARLLEVGILEADDIDNIADRLDARGKEDEAHIVRCMLLEQFAPSEAESKRGELRVLSGGKSDPE